MPTPEQIIAALQLQPHPLEGGWFRETYRSADHLSADSLPVRYGGPRAYGTAIYYLITAGNFSELHRLPTDEIFHFYLGDPVHMLQLDPDATGRVVTLGRDVTAGQHPQVVVPRGVWQGSRIALGGNFALLGATMAPGFDYRDYERGERKTLVRQYPAFREEIVKLTRG